MRTNFYEHAVGMYRSGREQTLHHPDFLQGMVARRLSELGELPGRADRLAADARDLVERQLAQKAGTTPKET